MVGEREVGQHGDAPGAVDLRAGRVGELGGVWRRLDPHGPDHRPGGNALGAALGLDVDAASVDMGHARVHTQFHTEVFELAGGGRRSAPRSRLRWDRRPQRRW